MPLTRATGTMQTGRSGATRFETALVVVIFAIAMGATVYPHRLVHWKEMGIHFEWLRLSAIAIAYAALVAALWSSRRWEWLGAVGGVFRQAPALALLVVLEVASTAWSVDWFHTFTRSIVLASTAVVGILLGLRYRVAEILTLLLVTTAALAAVTVIGVVLSVDVSMAQTTPGAWRGPFEHKNYLGRAMLVGCVALALKWTSAPPDRTTQIAQVSLAVVLGAALLLSRSATSQLLTAMALGLSFYLPYLLRPTTRREYAVAIAGGVVGAVLGAVALWYSADALSLLGKDQTLTGRSDVWSLLLPYVWDRPWSGYGFHAFWGIYRGAIQDSMQWTSVVEAYNGYIELLLDLGIPGLLLFLAALASAAYRSIHFYRRHPQREGLFPVLALFCLATLNVTGSHMVKYDDFWWMLFCLVVALTCQRGTRHRVEPVIG